MLALLDSNIHQNGQNRNGQNTCQTRTSRENWMLDMQAHTIARWIFCLWGIQYHSISNTYWKKLENINITQSEVELNHQGP